MKLLTRDQFREAVFHRDRHQCVLCGVKDVKLDAHHIVERRLFQSFDEQGGYFLDNGATVCEPCHLKCEQTLISVEEVRNAAGITNRIVPSHFYPDDHIDKWGNLILPNSQRLQGELFQDDSVQRVLSDQLHLFTSYVKYPRSHHLPWSPGRTKDDRVQHDLSGLDKQEVVITLKMDGENTTMYSDNIHARSLEYASRVDRDRVKALHASIAHDIPAGWRICGENMWAEHSISYQDLPTVFFVFSIWNDKNFCLSWDDTVEYAGMLGLQTVPVLFRGAFEIDKIKKFTAEPRYSQEAEGYVVRAAGGFQYRDFSKKLLKYVRQGHINTQAHWTRHIRPNGLLA